MIIFAFSIAVFYPLALSFFPPDPLSVTGLAYMNLGRKLFAKAREKLSSGHHQNDSSSLGAMISLALGFLAGLHYQVYIHAYELSLEFNWKIIDYSVIVSSCCCDEKKKTL